MGLEVIDTYRDIFSNLKLLNKRCLLGSGLVELILIFIEKGIVF